MTATLYLIAHKVRGEPAFDVAIQMDMPDGPWWIIPTSGHRAHPWDSIELSNVSSVWISELPPMPADLPDHYPIRDPAIAVPREAGVRKYNDELNAPRPEDL